MSHIATKDEIAELVRHLTGVDVSSGDIQPLPDENVFSEFEDYVKNIQRGED